MIEVLFIGFIILGISDVMLWAWTNHIANASRDLCQEVIDFIESERIAK